MSHWMIYWWVKLDDFQGACFVFVILGGSALVGLLLGWLLGKEDNINSSVWKTCRAIWFFIFPFFIIAIFLATFLPSTKQFAVIYLTPKIVNNEDVRELAGDGMKVMKHKLQEWLDENLQEGVKHGSNTDN